MIIDQLFENNKKNLNEVDPRNFDSDEDYYAAKNAPVKRRSAPSDYPYSSQEDDDYFREIFRKKREAAKKAEQDKDQSVAEEQVYESFYKVGRMLSERKMSEKEILDVFAQAEQGMTNTATGANRTMLGRGKDVTGKAVTSAKDAITKVLSSIQNSTPVAGVDVAYDQATDALANAVGPNSKVMDSIKKYRLLAKEYPKTQLFVKTALIALAGLATGGAALPVIAGLTAAVDAAIKGEKLSSIIGKGAGAGLMGLGAEEVSSMLSGADAVSAPDGNNLVSNTDSLAPGEEIVPPGVAAPGAEGFGGGTYTVQAGDQGGYIAQSMGIPFKELEGLNPQITNWNKLPIGTELQLPPTGDNVGSVWRDLSGAPSASTDATAATAPATTAPATTAQPGTPFRNPLGMGWNGTTVANIPVIPGQPLTPTQMAVADMSIQSGNQLSPVVQAAYDLAKRGAIRESIRFKIIPADLMIDQKLTVLTWALNESVNRKGQQSVHLTSKGVYTVFENVDRYRKAIVEYTQPGREQIPDLLRPDAPGAPVTPTEKPGWLGRGLNALDRGAKKVGGALSNFGHQFTTGVTKEKLKMNWHQAGKPTDSDQLAAWLVTQKVPQEVVSGVFSKMGIPYTAPVSAVAPQAAQAAPAAATGGAQKQMAFYGTNPATKKPWTYDELQAKATAGVKGLATADATAASDDTQPTTATSNAATKFPGEDPTGPNYVGRREVARRQAARDAAAKTPAKPNFVQQGGGYAQVNQPTSIKYTGMPAAKPAAKPAVKPTTATLPAGGGAGVSGAYNAKTGAATLGGKTMTAMKDLPPHIQQQLASTVKEATRKVKPMIENATSADDTKRIKNCIDTEFAKLGVMTESIYAIRDKMLADVTHMVAIRRREHARKS